MLARLWHGITPVAKSDAYLGLMQSVAIPDYRAIAGNLAAHVLRRIEGDVAHFQMLTFWTDLAAVKAFAGEDHLAAKYYDFDRAYLLELEPLVTMYDVFQ